MSRFGWVAVGLVACGQSPEAYLEKANHLQCELAVDCADEATLSFSLFSTVEECEDFLNAFNGPIADACDFDKGKAKECIGALEAATCDDQAVPAACGQVFTGEACLADSTSSSTSDTGF